MFVFQESYIQGMVMIKKIVLGVFFVATLPVMFYAYLLFQNNQSVEEVTPDKISSSLERSIVWLVDNHEQALKEDNAMLWWMIKRSSEITQDYRLLQIFGKYQKSYIDTDSLGVWQPLFSPYANVSVSPEFLFHLPDYNLYFIYGLTCDAGLAQLDIIQRQKNANFCPETHPISPACVTHQLMGLRFRQDKTCGDKTAMADQVKQLQTMIIKQLTLDPRLIDVYLQRVLMLVDTGAMQEVKHQWIENILDAQSIDGGWGDFQSLLVISNTRHVGFYSRGVKLGAPEDTLHATAQGMLLMSILVQLEADSR